MFNPHESAANLIKDCRYYSQARKILKKYWLTHGEQDVIIRLAKEKFKIELI